MRQLEQMNAREKNVFKQNQKIVWRDYPNVVPVINSACELMVSAMKSSLYASLGLFQIRPFKKIGRSCGVKGPKTRAASLKRFFGAFSFCFSSACRSALTSPVR